MGSSGVVSEGSDRHSVEPASHSLTHSLSGSGRGKGGRREAGGWRLEAECGMHALLAHVWLVVRVCIN